jgi:hypothetical protein
MARKAAATYNENYRGIGPVMAGAFVGIFTVEVDFINASKIIAIPDATTFNIIFLVVVFTLLAIILMLVIMRQRMISMALQPNK